MRAGASKAAKPAGAVVESGLAGGTGAVKRKSEALSGKVTVTNEEFDDLLKDLDTETSATIKKKKVATRCPTLTISHAILFFHKNPSVHV